MNNNGGKKTGVVRVLIAILLLMSATLGVWTFCNGKLTRTEGSVYVFDGWIYGHEDQKKASAALASAGLNDYSWQNGKLSVPADKKGEFQATLANAGAYPKAPSELRVEAVREMSVFESDAKTRIRELNACAMQLERTIEQMRDVEYATVGVRSRKEQVGLVAKNIITASVGVAFHEGRAIDSDTLSAITVATKHQLGIDDVANISIIDLKEGKSYFGVENAVGVSSDIALISEKERIEKYWRKKYLEAFSDIKNLRVSVVADVVYVGADRNEQEALKAANSHVSPTSYVERTSKTEEVDTTVPRRLTLAPVEGRFETLGNLAEIPVNDGEGRNLPESSTGNSELLKKNNTSGFAQLGNPNKTHVRAARKRREPVLTAGETKNTRGDVAVKTFSQFQWIDSSACSQITSPSLANEERRYTRASRVVPIFEKSLKDGVSDAIFYSGVCLHGVTPDSEIAYKPMASIRQVNSVEAEAERDADVVAGRNDGSTQLRSIAVRIAVPRSYLRGVVVRNMNASTSQETFAVDPEERALGEIKRYAIDLFRPTGEQLGWSDDDFERWFVVMAFSDSEPACVNDADRKNDAGAEGRQTALEHSSLYVQEQDDWKSVKPDSEAGESRSDELISGNEGAQDNLVVVAEPNGKVAKVSQTVASDVETLSNDVEHEVEDLEKSFVQAWSSVCTSMSWIQDPLVRNIGFATVVALLFIGILLGVRRPRKRREVDQNSSKSLVKRRSRTNVQEDASLKKHGGADSLIDAPNNNGTSRFQNGISNGMNAYFSELDDLDEYNDELEGELQEIATAHDASTSRQAARVGHDANLSSTRRVANVPSDEYWTKRREALELIAQYPERAAASLQKWVKNT